MPYFYVLLLIYYTTALFAQPQASGAQEKIQQLVEAIYEREELSKSTLVEVREKIRQNITSNAMLLQFDEYISGLIKKDRAKNQLSKELHEHIQQFISLDSLTQLIKDWQISKLQNLRLLQYHLTKENFATSTFSDTSSILQYLSFFNIQTKDAVAELGAGSGWLSLLLCILYNDIELHINELGTYSLRYAQGNLRAELSKAQLARCHFATGSKTSTGLETQALDVIIAVDAFHHFTNKPSMLQSIKWSLAKDGRLCLVEQVKTIGTAGDYFCPEALEKWELEMLLQQNGFVKTREQQLRGPARQNIYLLEYRVNPL